MDHTTVETALRRLTTRVETTLFETGDEFPYFADPDSGKWCVTEDGNWCGGHWIGMLWLAYDLTGDRRYARAADEHWATVQASMPPNSMFYGMNYHYAGFRAYDVTGESRHREIGLRGARAMCEFYDETTGQIPLGEFEIESPASNFRGPASEGEPSGTRLGAVDALYAGTTVLWRAARETGEQRYRDVARAHADRHIDWYVREDGSTWHHAEFDPETGQLCRQFNELAYSDETCWARGQGWNVAGLARAYRETGARSYLDALRTTVDYYISNTPDDLVPYWDFEHPNRPDVPRDTSAAALTAYGLVQLPDEVPHLVDLGERIVDSLVTDYLTPREGRWNDLPEGRVLESCYNGPAGFATCHEHVWTDYYLMYALHHCRQSQEA